MPKTPGSPGGPTCAPPAKDGRRPFLLLHVCCGPCATHVITCLQMQYHLIAFFCNPNIHPEEEYVRRLRAAATVCGAHGVALWLPPHRAGIWEDAVRGLEQEREGGARCRVCFSLRLRLTAHAARSAGIPAFATTLTVSPHKDSQTIHRIGEEAAAGSGRFFVPQDFKKDHGFQKSVQQSRNLGLYRQRSCGCRFSQRPPTGSRP